MPAALVFEPTVFYRLHQTLCVESYPSKSKNMSTHSTHASPLLCAAPYEPTTPVAPLTTHPTNPRNQLTLGTNHPSCPTQLNLGTNYPSRSTNHQPIYPQLTQHERHPQLMHAPSPACPAHDLHKHHTLPTQVPHTTHASVVRFSCTTHNLHVPPLHSPHMCSGASPKLRMQASCTSHAPHTTHTCPLLSHTCAAEHRPNPAARLGQAQGVTSSPRVLEGKRSELCVC